MLPSVIATIFVIAYAAIALEHPIKVNKSASALVGAGVLWTVYAVFSGNKALAARGIADPFEMRSFAPPEGSPLEGQGHHIERAQTALISVAVPGLTLKSPELEGLSLQLYRIKPGAPVFHVDPSIFQKLQKEERLEMQIHVPPATLSQQIRLKAASPTSKPQ